MTDTLRFNSLRCENFMPYVDEMFSFPRGKKGILLINGQNGNGKSSIVNAIRFALFGDINHDNDDFTKYVNKLGYKGGKYDFTITLDVDYLDTNYKIIRKYLPKNNNKKPISGDDYYHPKLSVFSGNRILLESEQEKLLSKIMKKEVARFYLFDGELLNEYNAILSGNIKNTSIKIKQSIEDILGLPLLISARDHLHNLYDEKKLNFQEISQKNEKSASFGETLKNSQENIDYYENEIAESTKNYNTLSEKLVKLDEEYDQYHSDIEKIGEKKQLNEEINKLEKKYTEISVSKSKLIESSWKILIYPLLSHEKELLESDQAKLKKSCDILEEREKLIQKLSKSIEEKVCEFCGQSLNKEHIDELKAKLNSINVDDCDIGDPKEIKENFDEISGKISKINKLMKDYKPYLKQQIIDSENELTNINQELIDEKIRLNDLIRELENSGLSDEKLASIKKDRDDTLQNRNNVDRAIKSLSDKLEMERDAYNKTMKKLETINSNDSDFDKAKFEESFVYNLYSLFEKSVDIYRDDKRRQVEESASILYRNLSTADYVSGLRITEGYGLYGIDKSGETLSTPSAGYSHLQTFALIGGLHQNVPIKGPLFLDTPSGRLDRSNTSNLIKVLPELSDQVILLVHDKEFDQNELHAKLEKEIVGEYIIEKIDNNRSKLVCLGGN